MHSRPALIAGIAFDVSGSSSPMISHGDARHAQHWPDVRPARCHRAHPFPAVGPGRQVIEGRAP
jgi:hypothetical protein